MNPWYQEQLVKGRLLVRGRLSKDDPLWAHLRLYCLYCPRIGELYLATVTWRVAGDRPLEARISYTKPDDVEDWMEQLESDLMRDFAGEPQASKHTVVWNTKRDEEPLIPMADPRLFFHEGGALHYLKVVRATTSDRRIGLICDSAIPKLEGHLRTQFGAWENISTF